eukprot:Colp12_sorted_trinity150504_noHs@18120
MVIPHPQSTQSSDSCCGHEHTSEHNHDHSKPHVEIVEGVPKRGIFSQEDLECFLDSDCCKQYLQFLQDLNDSVKGKKLTDECFESEICGKLLAILDTLDNWIADIPAEANCSRYGNPSFRKWLDKVNSELDGIHEKLVPTEFIPEVRTYLSKSFGDHQRIDYGTGHETNFACWLYCLKLLGLIEARDYSAIILKVFVRYINLMHKLQLTYWLEPAGSHGVWGLDDYHFLPFYFGAAQLVGHKHLRPKAILYTEFVNEFSKQYLYFDCIRFVNEVKTESLVWHSPMLNDISAVKTWDKVNSGLLKMYKAEVLGKLPIMQHFMFGSLIHFVSVHPAPEEGSAAYNHEHTGPACCISRLPSAAAAKAEKQKRHLIPFD